MSVSSKLGAYLRQPHVGFVTESFLDHRGAIFDDGAEPHLLRLAAGLGAEVTVYECGAKLDRQVVEGIAVVPLQVPLSRLGRTLAARAIAAVRTPLHVQYLERSPWTPDSGMIIAKAHSAYRDAPYDAGCRRWYPRERLSSAGAAVLGVPTALTVPACRLLLPRTSPPDLLGGPFSAKSTRALRCGIKEPNRGKIAMPNPYPPDLPALG